MGQSLSQNYLHIVFGTKHRKPSIRPPFDAALHQYITAVSLNLKCPVLAIGGYTDHVHLLIRLSPRISQSENAQKIKSNSSRRMKSFDHSLSEFAWQVGYASMSVSYDNIRKVKSYIDHQHEHHEKLTYREEIVRILKENDLDYDERYFWT